MRDFSTATRTTRAVTIIVMMGTLQEFFEYNMLVGCGLPSVNQLGKKTDWEEISRRVGELKSYGKEGGEWSDWLKPVMRIMVMSFKNSKKRRSKGLWRKFAYEKGRDGNWDDVETISG